MLAFIHTTIFLFQESAFTRFYEEYLNIPGFEAWKFLNLAIFVGLMIYFLRRPLGAQFKAKRDQIRAELIRTEEERKAALTRLTTIEAKIAQLESEKENILARAREESEEERRRLSEQTNTEIKRLREQVESEIARVANQTRAELRRFSAEESVRRAEQKLRSQIGPADDARLVKASIQEIGGLN
jgi:F0F1-type ATP synthase membrane subunit b/b'